LRISGNGGFDGLQGFLCANSSSRLNTEAQIAGWGQILIA